jgi:hypothetical protein
MRDNSILATQSAIRPSAVLTQPFNRVEGIGASPGAGLLFGEALLVDCQSPAGPRQVRRRAATILPLTA